MEPSVEVKNLYKRYRNFDVLKGVNFSVGRGEIFGLLGPNGAGKSTLIHIISGILKASSGTVRVSGIDVQKRPAEIKRLVGVSLQKNSFYESLTVKENIEYFGSLYGISRNELEQRTDGLLELFGLDAKRDVAAKRLSGGMRKKMNIICSLIHSPEVLILDEPTGGLDPISKRNLWEIIRIINKSNTTVIITSHLMEDIEALCDRVAILVSGNVIAEGTIEQLKSFVNISLLRIKIDPKRESEVESILRRANINFEMFDDSVIIRSTDPRLTYDYIRGYISQYIKKVEIVAPSIEDVFLYFVKRYDIKNTQG